MKFWSVKIHGFHRSHQDFLKTDNRNASSFAKETNCRVFTETVHFPGRVRTLCARRSHSFTETQKTSDDKLHLRSGRGSRLRALVCLLSGRKSTHKHLWTFLHRPGLIFLFAPLSALQSDRSNAPRSRRFVYSSSDPRPARDASEHCSFPFHIWRLLGFSSASQPRPPSPLLTPPCPLCP